MGDITLDRTALEAVAAHARETALIRAAAKIVVLAQTLCPVGLTGHLRRSIERGDIEAGARAVWVVATALYSLYVERGTGRYATEGNGRKTPWVYYNAALRRHVWTDGTRAQPFMGPAMQAAESEGI